MAIQRKLAAAYSDAFKANLALSLAVRANCLEALDRADEALAGNVAAIEALRPTFLVRPLAVIHWMQPMCAQYLQRAEKLGVEPDAELLGPIVEIFQGLPAQDPSRGEQT